MLQCRETYIPYFEPLGVTLAGLQPRQIQSFYLHEAETLKNTSILRFHANLHKALKYAVRIDLPEGAQVLRVGEDVANIWGLSTDTLPLLCGAVVLILLAATLFSWWRPAAWCSPSTIWPSIWTRLRPMCRMKN